MGPLLLQPPFSGATYSVRREAKEARLRYLAQSTKTLDPNLPSSVCGLDWLLNLLAKLYLNNFKKYTAQSI